MNRLLTFFCALALCLADAQAQTGPHACEAVASAACLFTFQPVPAGHGTAGQMHYYASRDAAAVAAGAPTAAFVAVHGFRRDAPKTFNSALLAVHRAEALGSTLVVAPLFQVGADEAGRCQAQGVPPAQAGDLLWTCQSWAEGAAAVNGGGLTAFAALDALAAELYRRWPSLRSVTVAGFSAGGQLVQHYIGFADLPVGGPQRRYLVASPGSWLYFEPVRPAAPAHAPPCTGVNRWKYGTDALPAGLLRSASQARTQYASAEVSYLVGDRDSGNAPGAFYRILDKSCAAQAQGQYRLQRAVAYAAYDRDWLEPALAHPLVVVPGCAHDVACVLASAAVRPVLLKASR